jgi:hypothetical protein
MHDDAPVLRFVERASGARCERFDWFRDEVAVDFPSLGTLVDRMRESFLGTDEAVAPLAAVVRLSAREARSGGCVPVDLALRSTCAACGGRGEVWSEPCDGCAGSGGRLTHHQVRVHLPSGVRDGARFLFNLTRRHAAATVVDLRVCVG